MPDPLRGACDCHAHVFPPIDQFEPSFETSYAQPVRTVEEYLATLRDSGLDRGVLVQPAVYGTDLRALMFAVKRGAGRLRGIGAADASISDGALNELCAHGIAGLRFTEVRDPSGSGRYRGTVGLATLDALAPMMRGCGLHAQLWAPLDVTIENLPRLRAYGIPVVLDHMAMLPVAAGTGHADFQALLNILEEGWLWLKLCLPRVTRQADHSDARPFHDALLARAPESLLWGSDWPFVRIEPAPVVATLLARFLAWADDEELRSTILVRNPARLYHFAPTGNLQ